MTAAAATAATGAVAAAAAAANFKIRRKECLCSTARRNYAPWTLQPQAECYRHSEILNDVAFGHKELMQTPSAKIFKYSLRLQQTWMTEGHKSILNIRLYIILTL